MWASSYGSRSLPDTDLRRQNQASLRSQRSRSCGATRGGQDKFVHAKAVDISELGLRLQMPEALPQQIVPDAGRAEAGARGTRLGAPLLADSRFEVCRSAWSLPPGCGGRRRIRRPDPAVRIEVSHDGAASSPIDRRNYGRDGRDLWSATARSPARIGQRGNASDRQQVGRAHAGRGNVLLAGSRAANGDVLLSRPTIRGRRFRAARS